MAHHPAIAAGRVAVITGAASGIGRAAAARFASLGLKLCLTDVNAGLLEQTAAALRANGAEVSAQACDVSRIEDVQHLKDAAYAAFGDVAILMNNAGTAPGGGPFEQYDRWRRVLDVNLFGVINGIHAFTQAMIDQGKPAAIISTGSKQGITCPPGDTAYNVSKAGVKVATEGLAHALREIPGCRVSAHLLVPGFVFTGMTRGERTERPAAAWTPEQAVEFLLAGLAQGDFYIICPDNDVTRDMDNRRMRWASDDVIKGRPALSRWHPDYKDAFAAFMQADFTP